MKESFKPSNPDTLPNNAPNVPTSPQGHNIPMPSPESATMGILVDIGKDLVRCYTEYAKCREHEITERKRITATLKAIEHRINAQKEVILVTLEKDYEERNRLYDNLTKLQEYAIASNNIEALKITLNIMVQIFQTPLKINPESFLIGNTLGITKF